MPDETYKRLRHEPESWTVELHTDEVYVGTDSVRSSVINFYLVNDPKISFETVF